MCSTRSLYPPPVECFELGRLWVRSRNSTTLREDEFVWRLRHIVALSAGWFVLNLQHWKYLSWSPVCVCSSIDFSPFSDGTPCKCFSSRRCNVSYPVYECAWYLKLQLLLLLHTFSSTHLVKIITVKLFTGNDFMKWSFFPEISLSLTQRNTGNVCLYSMQVLHAATVVKKKSYCFLIQPIEGKGHGIKQQKKWDIWESIHRHQSLITVVSSDTRSPRP